MDVKLLTVLLVILPLCSAFPPQTIEAEEGDTVLFECQLDDQVDVSASPVTWSKDDRRNIVHVYILGRDRAADQKEAFRNRTFLFHDGLKRGNVTLQLSSVRLSDTGTFSCYIRRPDASCQTVLTVVKKGQLNRSLGKVSNITTPPQEAVPESEDPDNRRFVCAGIKYTVISIFCGVFGALVLMILGTVWIYKKVQTRRRREAERRTNNPEMQNLRPERRGGGGGGGGGEEHPTNAAENGSGHIQQEV